MVLSAECSFTLGDKPGFKWTKDIGWELCFGTHTLKLASFSTVELF